ncbi:MAG: hypothetical protein LBE38_02900 [Deltaproteobacteria bacterium]|jgi:hypothetical protein|nr:hypothetical protein [Deltaproteobacteria bacterium]
MPLRLTFILKLLLALALVPLFSACGVFTDMVRDNELSVPLLNSPDFLSPAKLRAGILPFQDQVTANPETGPNLARLMTEEYEDNGNLLMVPAAEVKRYVDLMGIRSPITAEQAVQICRDLNLNLVMEGTLAHIGQSQVRSGWRRLFRWFSNQQVYVEAILYLNAFDPSDGTIITSRAAESRIKVGRAPERGVMGEMQRYQLTQEDIEDSLDEALEGLYMRSLEGLRVFPFKAPIISTQGDTATINFGSEVRLRRGQEFAVLSLGDQVINPIGRVYNVPGAPAALLKVQSVSEGSTTLTIVRGTVRPGDFIQSWKFND